MSSPIYQSQQSSLITAYRREKNVNNLNFSKISVNNLSLFADKKDPD
jgi:hypothetical protein